MAGPKESSREWSGNMPVPEDDIDDYCEDVWTTPLSEGRSKAAPAETGKEAV
jgi:hypothetical protein